MGTHQSEHHADCAALTIGIDTETTEVRDGVGEVGLVRVLEMVPGPLLHYFLGDLDHVLCLYEGCVGDAAQLTVDPHSWRGANLQVKI